MVAVVPHAIGLALVSRLRPCKLARDPYNFDGGKFNHLPVSSGNGAVGVRLGCTAVPFFLGRGMVSTRTSSLNWVNRTP